MSEFDKKLIEEANAMSRWHWRRIRDLMNQAESDECRERLYFIMYDLYYLCEESL